MIRMLPGLNRQTAISGTNHLPLPGRYPILLTVQALPVVRFPSFWFSHLNSSRFQWSGLLSIRSGSAIHFPRILTFLFGYTCTTFFRKYANTEYPASMNPDYNALDACRTLHIEIGRKQGTFIIASDRRKQGTFIIASTSKSARRIESERLDDTLLEHTSHYCYFTFFLLKSGSDSVIARPQ